MYIICFFVGFIYAIFSMLFGNVFDFEFDIDGGGLPYFSPITIASFVTVFGGSGLFLSHFVLLPAPIILVISVLVAVMTAAAMLFFVVVPLYKAQKSSAFSDRDMVGRFGEVITPILLMERGEIIYEQGGSRLSAPALSVDKKNIGVGEIIEIVDVISGTFIVKKLEERQEEE
jgi:membrane-bound ClpP family serine protease